MAQKGVHPAAEKRREALTFAEAAARVHATFLPTWKNAKHAETWLATIKSHANPVFGSRAIESIGAADVLKVLAPIRTTKHETAKRPKQRISTA